MLVYMLMVCAVTLVPVNGLAEEPVVLRLTTQNGENNLSSIKALQPWVEQVEEATAGKVKIQVFYSETLAKGKDSWKAVTTGIADIGWCPQGYWPGLTPMADVISLPGIPFGTAEEGSALLWELYNENDTIQKEFQQVKVLLLHTSEPYLLISRNKEIVSLEDLRGLKIRTFGDNMTSQVGKLGAIPVSIPMPDTYLALQKGVVDGMGAPWEAINGFRFYEVVNHYTEVPFGALFFSVSMNRKTWNKLDSKTQEAIMRVSGEQGSRFWGRNFFDLARTMAIDNAAKAGKQVEVRQLSADERKRWIALSRPIWEEWIADNEKVGNMDARQLLERALQEK
ncbi:MAG: TRAP transporter substrate-binding protein [Desulfopila sp.]